jgi:hypothetical protein
MNKHNHTQWEGLIGAIVEIRHNGSVVRTGMVDDAMTDGSAIWISADSSQPRRIYEKSEGFLVYVEPRQLTGKSTYRMTTGNLYQAHVPANQPTPQPRGPEPQSTPTRTEP